LSNTITYPITLDIRRNLYQVLVMKESDANSRIIEATITDNGKPYDVTSDIIAIKWRKPDGHVIYNIAYAISDNNHKITIICTDQMLCVAGVAEAEFVFYRNDEVVSTMKFNASIDASVVSNIMIESSDEFGLLNELVSKNKELRDELEELEKNVEEAEAKRVVAENNRVSAENSRVEAETSRVNAEKDRVTAESNRVSAENTRKNNETERQNAENTRKSNENTRIDAENIRISNENTRISAENTRNTNENTRKSNESTRQTNETERINAEINREKTFDDFMDTANSEVERLRQENDTASANALSAKEYMNSAKESANSAATSATASALSETNAKNSETISTQMADLAKSYVVGTDGVIRKNDNQDCALYYWDQTKRIAQGVGGLIYMGTITFSELSDLNNQEPNYMFNISDEFVTDDTFKEGEGHLYKEGTNVCRTADGYWDALASYESSGSQEEVSKTEPLDQEIASFWMQEY
jgi:hypothetical protein